PLEEEKIRLSDGIVRLQAGTNKYDSQKVIYSNSFNKGLPKKNENADIFRNYFQQM
ncbi:hypothetical protein WUBG_17003, partial [Wuchereria bancrofti]